MYNGSTILPCVTIFVIHKQCLIRAHCSIVTVLCICSKLLHSAIAKVERSGENLSMAYMRCVTCQTLTGQVVWQVVRRDGDQVDGKWMVDA
jgi:hypothetical protein